MAEWAAPSSIPAPRLPGRGRALALFYLGVPAATAVLFGLNHSGLARHLPVSLGVLYWLALLIPYWLVLDLCSRAAALALRPLRAPDWLILLAGSVIGMACVAPLVPIYAAMFEARFAPDVSYVVQNDLLGALGDLNKLVKFSGVPLYWIAANLLAVRLARIPEYLARTRLAPEPRVGAVGEQLADTEAPGILLALPARVRGDVLWMRAEDHYVRVCTTRGEGFVRYRFSDAVRELRARGGHQVHRSFWVHASFIERIVVDGETYRLQLKNGDSLRVSRPYIGVVKAIDLD